MALLYVCDRCDKRDADKNKLGLILVSVPVRLNDDGSIASTKRAELCAGCRNELARMLEPIPKGPIARG